MIVTNSRTQSEGMSKDHDVFLPIYIYDYNYYYNYYYYYYFEEREREREKREREKEREQSITTAIIKLRLSRFKIQLFGRLKIYPKKLKKKHYVPPVSVFVKHREQKTFAFI